MKKNLKFNPLIFENYERESERPNHERIYQVFSDCCVIPFSVPLGIFRGSELLDLNCTDCPIVRMCIDFKLTNY